MSESALDKIILCGSGLAFEATLAALNKSLPSNLQVIALEINGEENKDIFYGNITSPHAYDFHLSIGLSEPDLIYQAHTTFAYGTHYKNWATQFDWVQCYNLPFPVWQGTPFHHYLLRSGRSLEDFLVGAACGKKSKFAHPPNDGNIALSRAEYGYQIRPNSLTTLLKKRRLGDNIVRMSGVVKGIHIDGDNLSSIELTTGEQVSGQIYIDATGPESPLMQALGNHFRSKIALHIAESLHKAPLEGSSLREVSGETFGWKSESTVRNAKIVQTISHPDQIDETLAVHSKATEASEFLISTGRTPQGWSGNCVAIGHASYVMEPLTPAPMMLLYRDIDRLLSLIPHSSNMAIERKEFNRLRDNDIEHAGIFQNAFYQLENRPMTPYWQEISALNISDKLTRKITQFQSRAFLTKFDLEPFNDEDWTILHLGMRRRSERHLDSAHGFTDVALTQKLNGLAASIESISERVPPHDLYLKNFIQYIEKKIR